MAQAHTAHAPTARRAHRALWAGLAGIGLVGGIGLATSTAAHADGKPLCIYVVSSGASGDISKIKCVSPDRSTPGDMQPATWNGLSLVAPDGSSTIGYYTANAAGKDFWAYDPGLVSFGDFKKELMRDWGYASVSLTGDTDNGGQPEVAASYDRPSKTKH